FVYGMKQDGSGRRKVLANPVVQMETVSPDGQWLVVQVGLPDEDPARGVIAESVSDGQRVRLCRGVCGGHWSADGRAMFVSLPGRSHGEGIPWGTFVIPLPAGKLFPNLPPLGISSATDVSALAGVRNLEKFATPGLDAGSYLFNRIAVHRNLFRIPLS